MHSATAVTYETFDQEAAALELVAQIRSSMPETRNRCGILFLDPDYDGEALTARLEKKLDMPVIGATSAAMLSGGGYHADCATLLVLGGDDCVFSTALSGDITGDTAEEALAACYERARAGLGKAEPVMTFLLSAPSPGCTEDVKLAMLHRISGGMPVFGGVAADRFEFAHTRVFGEGSSGASSVALLLIGGNVRPKFVMRNMPRKHLSRSRITGAHTNVVHTIDGVPCRKYMEEHGADCSSTMALHFTPLLVETRDCHKGEEHVVCRPIISFDEETGDGITITAVPEGSAVTVQAIEPADIAASCREAMQALLVEMEADPGYTYSTVIIITCAARHMVLAFDKEREAMLAEEILPPSLTRGGYYSFGEFCPIAVQNGKADNRLHNLSLGLCAL